MVCLLCKSIMLLHLLNTLFDNLSVIRGSFFFFAQKIIIEHRKNYKPGNEADVIDMFFNEMKNNEESNVFTGTIKL